MVGSPIVFQYGSGAKGQGVENGHRSLKQPRGLRVGADGQVLVADFGNNCITKFGPNDRKGKIVAGGEGKLLPSIDYLRDLDRPLGPVEGEGTLLKHPSDACMDPEGCLLVLDTEACRVQRFGKTPGQLADVIVPPPGSTGSGKSQSAPEAIKYPRALRTFPDGSVVICDTWSHRLLRWESVGEAGRHETPTLLAGSANSCGTRSDQLAFPSGFDFDADGFLYVADTNNHRVQRLAPGELAGITVAGSASCQPGSGLGELNMPTCVCVDAADGSLLVTDRANSRVLRFKKEAKAGDAGEIVLGPEAPLERPWGVCIGPRGHVFVSDERRAVVLKVDVGRCGPGSADEPLVPEEEPLFEMEPMPAEVLIESVALNEVGKEISPNAPEFAVPVLQPPRMAYSDNPNDLD